MNTNQVTIDGSSLNVETVHAVAREMRPVRLAPGRVEAMEASRQLLQRLIDEGAMIYGITTGMGGMREFLVPKHVAPEMQMNLLRAVATNAGEGFPDEVV